MGGAWSTQSKTFDDRDFNADAAILCGENYGDPPTKPLTDRYRKYVDVGQTMVYYRFLNSNLQYFESRFVKIPDDTTVGDYCTVFRAFYGPQAKVYFNESVCVFSALILLILSIYYKNAIYLLAAAVFFWRAYEPQTTQTFASLLQEANAIPAANLALKSSVMTQSNEALEQYKNNSLALAHSSVSSLAPTFDARQGMFIQPLLRSENDVRTDLVTMLPNSKLDLHSHETTATSAFAITKGLSVSFDGHHWTSWPVNETITINSSTPHTIKSGPVGGTFITTHGGSIEDDYIPV